MHDSKVEDTRALPVGAYGLLASDVPDIQLKPFVVQRLDVKALCHRHDVNAGALPGMMSLFAAVANWSTQRQALPVLE